MKYFLKYILVFFPIYLLAQNGVQDSTLAYPGAMGGGRFATGGKGGILHIVDNLGTSQADEVYHPTNCNVGGHSHTLPLGNAEEFYTGGFLSNIENPNVGPIVFNISGPIELDRGTGNAGGTTIMGFGYDGIAGANKTIYGQSAPLGGITFTGGLLRFGSSSSTTENDNLIIRYIRSRPIYNKAGVKTITDDASTWGLNIYGGDDIIVDHCSFSWAQDKAGGSYIVEAHADIGATMIGQTWSHNIFGDSNTGAYTSINPNRAGNPEELVDQISYLSNLIIGVNRTPNLAFDGDAEDYNNIKYNIPFKYTRAYHDIRLNNRGNWYEEYGSGTYEFHCGVPRESADVPQIHSSGNYLQGTISRDEYSYTANFDGTLSQDNKQLWTKQSSGPAAIILDAYYTAIPHDFSAWSNTILTTPQVAYADVITDGNVGANKYLDNDGYVQTYYDATDLAMIDAVRNKTNWVNDVSRWTIPTTSNTRPGTYDTDYDGMSDAWELRVFGDLSQSYSGDFDGDGDSNLKEYMNQVDTGNSSANTGYSVSKVSGLVTSENGGTDNFYVVLTSQPTTDVVFNITSSDASEGTISPTILTFTSVNWNNNQQVIVTGVDDALDDGNVSYTITVSVDDALSDDNYDGLPDTNVQVINIDNDLSSEPGSGNRRTLKTGFTTIHN